MSMPANWFGQLLKKEEAEDLEAADAEDQASKEASKDTPRTPWKKRTSDKVGRFIKKSGKISMALPLDTYLEDDVTEEFEALDIPVAPTDRDLYDLSMKLLEENKVALAFRVAEETEKLPKVDARIGCALWTNVGNAYYDLGHVIKVSKAFTKAYEFNSSHVSTCFNMGVACHGRNQLEDAKVHYEKAIDLDPTQPKVWCNLGVVAFQQNDNSDSERCMRRAIELRPDYARAWDNLGAILGAEEKMDEALKACFKALELKNDLPEAWFKVGLIYFEREDYHKAHTSLRKATTMKALEVYIKYYLAIINVRLDKVEEASKLCDEAFAADPRCEVGPSAWAELGDGWLITGDDAKADRAFNRAEALRKELDDSGEGEMGVS